MRSNETIGDGIEQHPSVKFILAKIACTQQTQRQKRVERSLVKHALHFGPRDQRETEKESRQSLKLRRRVRGIDLIFIDRAHVRHVLKLQRAADSLFVEVGIAQRAPYPAKLFRLSHSYRCVVHKRSAHD